MKIGILKLCVLLFLSNSILGQNKWRFAVVGDTHVGSSDTIAEMVPYLLADSVDLVLLPGDIVEAGKACSGDQLLAQLTAWKELMQPLYDEGIGVYSIRGNHEADAHDNLNVWNSFFSGSNALPQNGPSAEQNLTYSFINKNALFIMLDNYVNIHTVNQEWLNLQFEENNQPNVFVLGHEQAFKVFHSDCLDDSVLQRNTFWQSLIDNRVKVYFCGHDHFFDVARIGNGDGNEDNDVYQYNIGTGGGWLMSQFSNYNGNNTPFSPSRLHHETEHGYALVEVSDDSASGSDVTITWKMRVWNSTTSSYQYTATSSLIQYSTSAPTSVNETSIEGFDIYPNPASSYITIAGFSGNVRIYNMLGRLMWNGLIQESKTLDVSQFQAGIYIVQCDNLSKRVMVLQ
ncbi:hypothetical protein CYCD_14310 [Tenuifilaceae bacterium CYCD]|nr:hypothetical protein CYCD_14310 [Tenuifilaceae bacterium CYCD]